MDVLEKVGDKWCATVDLGDGSPVQKFYGDTQDEVVTELIKAQQNATRTIREHKKAAKLNPPQTQPARELPKFEPRSLSVDERFNLSQQLNDPSKNAEAVRALIEAELGAPIETVRQTLTLSQEQAFRQQIAEEAKRFLNSHPDFVPNAENDQTMIQYLEARGLAYTAHNLDIAYEDLKDVLILKTATPQVATVVRPRSASTGIPARSNTRTPSTPVGPTAEEINKMDPSEYRRRLGDPQFRAHVNKLFGPKSPRP